MSDDRFLDPFAFWRDSLQQLQKGFNQFATDRMQSEDFAKLAGQFTTTTTATKRVANDLSAKYFELIGLPTRADVQALDDRLQRIEDMLVNLTAGLNREESSAASLPSSSRSAPTRNRKPPAPPEVAPTPSPPPSPSPAKGAVAHTKGSE